MAAVLSLEFLPLKHPLLSLLLSFIDDGLLLLLIPSCLMLCTDLLPGLIFSRLSLKLTICLLLTLISKTSNSLIVVQQSSLHLSSLVSLGFKLSLNAQIPQTYGISN